MTKRTDHPDRLDPLIRDGLALIVRMKSGEATLEDAEQLIDWRSRSSAHERAFRDAVKCWRAIGPAIVSDWPTGQGPRRRKTRDTSRS